MLFCSSSIVSLSIGRKTIVCRSLGFLSFSLSLTFCSFVGQVAYELHRELEKLRAAVLREKEEERRKEKQEKVERWREEMEAGEEEEEEKVEELKREASLALKPREVFYFHFPLEMFHAPLVCM